MAVAGSWPSWRTWECVIRINWPDETCCQSASSSGVGWGGYVPFGKPAFGFPGKWLRLNVMVWRDLSMREDMGAVLVIRFDAVGEGWAHSKTRNLLSKSDPALHSYMIPMTGTGSERRRGQGR